MLGRETSTSERSPALSSLVGLLLTTCTPHVPPPAATTSAAPGLWQTYDQALKGARYIDLTHTLTPSIPVWHGFGASTFGPVVNLETGKPYTFADHAPDWPHGIAVGEVREAPLPRSERILQWDEARGMRVRKRAGERSTER